MRALLLALLTVIGAVPALAAISCEQSLKDTEGAFKLSTIGPKETQRAEAAIKQAEDLCKQGKGAEANELLRLARTMIGE
jgi:hypothetical protein